MQTSDLWLLIYGGITVTVKLARHFLNMQETSKVLVAFLIVIEFYNKQTKNSSKQKIVMQL